MEAQAQEAGKSTVLLIAVIKQKRRCCDASETRALTPNALFYNHDDESVGKTRLSFAVALARFSHTETPPLTDSHTETENKPSGVSPCGPASCRAHFLAEEAPHSRERRLFRMDFFLTK